MMMGQLTALIVQYNALSMTPRSMRHYAIALIVADRNLHEMSHDDPDVQEFICCQYQCIPFFPDMRYVMRF